MTRTLLFWTAACCLATAAVSAAAAPPPNNLLRIERVNMGSGVQNASGTDVAEPVGDLGVWHVPQYMPGFPTAATIWPRVVIVPCSTDLCSGYELTPELGRGEYLYFAPARR
ncbi:hypothetical protein SAMN05216567_101244 [Variovorax sp. OK605]|jgi:hypothetical protein|uniref:hypothetical protein n=1 Tax=unclassified Variovorax TaxID=663243 RepID=UPI0008D41775|nr:MULTISPECIES: hypothetical protein [unclassified Variovorax]SEJ77024.1 hypothetical protein SAMN05518853_103493 [Variovorax sp. OK202]SFC89960.1 hypothetical protein SAMN05444746_103493 [Variovorax sp. OK212]SFO54541.1 hypothetical protein SAMN05216567_101244 [Variovorax sp. OK605]